MSDLQTCTRDGLTAVPTRPRTCLVARFHTEQPCVDADADGNMVEGELASGIRGDLERVVNADPLSSRILIADEHPIFRDGLKRALETEPGLEVIGEAGDAVATLHLVRQLEPDLLLLDLEMPRGGGLDILRALTAVSKLPRTVVLTERIVQEQLVIVLKLGVRGVVLKEATTQSLCDSIRCVLRDQYALGPEQVGDLVRAMFGSPATGIMRRNPFRLTPRQIEIVSAVAIGETNKEVALHFSISEETVKHHLANIFDKLGVYSRLELAIFALNHGLVDGGA
jgi:two-component system nitrate/nitrite response regulator NarL